MALLIANSQNKHKGCPIDEAIKPLNELDFELN